MCIRDSNRTGLQNVYKDINSIFAFSLVVYGFIRRESPTGQSSIGLTNESRNVAHKFVAGCFARVNLAPRLQMPNSEEPFRLYGQIKSASLLARKWKYANTINRRRRYNGILVHCLRLVER